MIVVNPENVWYAGVKESDLPEILASHIVDGKPVERLRYEPGVRGANKIDVEAPAQMAEPARSRIARLERATQPLLARVVTRDYTGHMIASVRGAKARLSELLERAAGGEEIVIAAAGRPKAKLVGLGETALRPFRVNLTLLSEPAAQGRARRAPSAGGPRLARLNPRSACIWTLRSSSSCSSASPTVTST